MNRAFERSRHFRVLSRSRNDRQDVRTSDLVLALAGVGLLGGFCLMVLAGVSADPEHLANLPAPSGNS